MRIRRPALVYLALYGAGGAFVPYCGLYYQERGFDLAQIGLLFSVSALVSLLAAPAWGAVSDRVGGSPRVLLAGAGIALTGLAAIANAGGFEVVLAGNVILALGTGGMSPILDARALEQAGDARAGFGPLRAWGSLGWVLASGATGLAAQTLGLGVLFWASGMLIAATALLGLGLRPTVIERAERPLRSAMRRFLAPSLGLFVVGGFLVGAALTFTIDFLPLRLAELDAGSSIVGLASALPAAIEVPVMLAFPVLARRFGGHRLLVTGAAILGLRSLLSAIGTDAAFLVVAAAIGGVGYALFAIGGVTFVSERMPAELAATGQGVYQSVASGLSSVVGAAAGGAAARILGIDGLFGVATAVAFTAVVTIAVAVRVAERRGDRAPDLRWPTVAA